MLYHRLKTRKRLCGEQRQKRFILIWSDGNYNWGYQFSLLRLGIRSRGRILGIILEEEEEMRENELECTEYMSTIFMHSLYNIFFFSARLFLYKYDNGSDSLSRESVDNFKSSLGCFHFFLLSPIAISSLSTCYMNIYIVCVYMCVFCR